MLAAIGGGIGLAIANWFSDTLFGIFAEGTNVALTNGPRLAGDQHSIAGGRR